MSKTERLEAADQLREIQGRLRELLEEARGVLAGTGRILDRADAYWLGHIEAAVEGHNRYDVSMETTIKELEGGEDEDEADDDE